MMTSLSASTEGSYKLARVWDSISPTIKSGGGKEEPILSTVTTFHQVAVGLKMMDDVAV